MFDHGARDITPGFTEMKEDSLLLGLKGSDTAGDILASFLVKKLAT